MNDSNSFSTTAISEDVIAVTIISDAEDVESIECTSPCNPSGRSVVFVEMPAFNRSNSTMQNWIPDFYIQSRYSHFVSRIYLFILKLSVNGCLFLLSFQCHRIDRGGKEYRESTLGLHGRLDYLYLHHTFCSLSTPLFLKM